MTTAEKWLPWLLLVAFFTVSTYWERIDHQRELGAKDSQIEAITEGYVDLKELIRERLAPFVESTSGQ